MSKPPSHGTPTPEDFRRIRKVFESALELSPAERVPFVEQACGGNTLLIAEVGRMLAADAADNTLLDGRAPAGDRFRAGAIFAGHYQFAGLIGGGGMGEVYRGRDTTCACKLKIRRQPSPPMAGWRFQREAQLWPAESPNIGAFAAWKRAGSGARAGTDRRTRWRIESTRGDSVRQALPMANDRRGAPGPPSHVVLAT